MKSGAFTMRTAAATARRQGPKTFPALPLAFVLAAAAGLGAGLVPERAEATTVTFNSFTSPSSLGLSGTIGFAYAGNKFVGSVQKDGTGALYSTDVNGGNVQVFAPTVSLAPSQASEHFVASSLGIGGFPNRDLYVGEGTGIRHITNDGTSNDVFVSGLDCTVRGIFFDVVGTFHNDMLVTTRCGKIYRITSVHLASLLANVGEDTEGTDIAPLGAGFGSFDGQLIVGSEGSGHIRAIKNDGTVTDLSATYNFVIPGGPEQLSFVPLNLGVSGNPVEGMYGADYTPDVVKADASQFNGLQGDIVVTTEFAKKVYDIHWNGTTFMTSVIGKFPHNPEDGIFVTADIIGNKCPLDQEYWKHHPQKWPVTSLVLGSQTYSAAQLLAIYNLSPASDASVALAHQLIAADLNIANGSNGLTVSAAITDANNLLSTFAGALPYNVDPKSATGKVMENDATTLRRFNRSSPAGCTK